MNENEDENENEDVSCGTFSGERAAVRGHGESADHGRAVRRGAPLQDGSRMQGPQEWPTRPTADFKASDATAGTLRAHVGATICQRRTGHHSHALQIDPDQQVLGVTISGILSSHPTVLGL